MLVGPNQGETAVCGCHCPRDMAVHMRDVLVWPWVGVCVPLALRLHYFNAISSLRWWVPLEVRVGSLAKSGFPLLICITVESMTSSIVIT